MLISPVGIRLLDEGLEAAVHMLGQAQLAGLVVDRKFGGRSWVESGIAAAAAGG